MVFYLNQLKDKRPPPPISRSTDPPTSSEAAEHITTTGKRQANKRLALELLRANPNSTASELDAKAGSGEGKIRKRLGDLREDGLAKTVGTRVCRVTGRNAQTWVAVSDAKQKTLFDD